MQEIKWFAEPTDGDELLDTGEEIYLFIADKIATYPQEIATELGHSLRTVQYHLRKMLIDNHIGRLATPMSTIPARLLFRIAELQAQRISGARIRGLAWYCIYESGAQLRARLSAEGRIMPMYNQDRLHIYLTDPNEVESDKEGYL